MPSRLSRIFSGSSSKEKEAEAEAERNKDSSGSSSPPPGYSPAVPDHDLENTIEPPDATLGFKSLKLSGGAHSDTPQIDQCIAHLKLLECFYRLRQKVGSTDGAFSISDSFIKDLGLPESDKSAQVLAKLAEKRWAIYVSQAVQRFEVWFASLVPDAQPLTIKQFEDRGKEGNLCMPPAGELRAPLEEKVMPPVDVLMVYHAYMLNPRDFLEDCLRMGRMHLWQSGFPLEHAYYFVNADTFVYEGSEEAKSHFFSTTGLPWDQSMDPKSMNVNCPNVYCQKAVECRVTTFEMDLRSYTSWDELLANIDNKLATARGYCDPSFLTRCSYCRKSFGHDRLRVGKFLNDTRNLTTKDLPMGGTLLGYEGIPWKYAATTDTMFAAMRGTPFANKLLQAGLGSDLLTMERDLLSGVHNMDYVRLKIEEALKDASYMKKIVNTRRGRTLRADRVSVRKMMARYWDNSSPFALDLVGAVIRQGSFVEKMHNIDWLHSPALPNTMKRLLVKYLRFVSIMRDKKHMAVPTLDVDLAWHTHQLSPPDYMSYTVSVTGQFIDHDDKVAETALNDAFAWTSKTYHKQYGEPYSECTCWYCEAIRESHTNAASRLFNTKNSEASAKLHAAEQDPAKSVHISTHNAVRPANDSTYDKLSAEKAAELESHYQKACERARKKGRPEPKRDDYYWSDAYGYPVWIPAYSPYMGFYPYTPIVYPANPGCMAIGAGATGNCCSGTCGGGVAAGACAAAGGCGSSGGCAGGAAGGCGGGGGGGGGCGGGGGGGGGCGGGGGGG